MLRRTTLIAILATLILTILPSSTTAQNQNSSPRVYHGWSPYNFAPSAITANLIYLVDSEKEVLAVNTDTGRVVGNASLTNTPYLLSEINVDSNGYVYVSAYSYSRGAGPMLLIFDGNLTLQTNISLSTLKPATSTYDLQIVIDYNGNTVYLFDGNPYSNTRGYVWVLRGDGRTWTQLNTFNAPINLANYTGYVIGIDHTGLLYFQAVSGYKIVYISDAYGGLQAQFQLGTGNMSEPWIDDIAIDSQLRMWHTHEANSYISVTDTNGKLLSVYDILSDNTYYSYRTNHIAVDMNGNVICTDTVEQSLLYVSQRGDITNTISSFIAPMWSVTELLGDYVGGGRGAGSLLFNDNFSPYAAQRISVDDYDTGALLQRYSLPARLDGPCRAVGLDIGSKTGNIYMLLHCDYWPLPDHFSLVYVVAQSGRVVSEFRVYPEASRVRVDEGAATLYVTVNDQWQGPAGMVMAYSMIDGTNTVNFTGSNPPIQYISDLTLIMPGPMGGPTTIVVIDRYNNRFILFDSSSAAAPSYVAFPFNPITYYNYITFSFGPQPSFYVSGNSYGNGTSIDFVQKFAFDPNSNASAKLTDIYSSRPGVNTDFGPIVVGLDRHLYAYDFQTGSLYQWRDADGPPRPPAISEPMKEEPRVHIGEAVVGSADAQDDAAVSKAAATPSMSAQNRHSRMRGARSP